MHEDAVGCVVLLLVLALLGGGACHSYNSVTEWMNREKDARYECGQDASVLINSARTQAKCADGSFLEWDEAHGRWMHVRGPR
jgi:NADH:ubiquinone oxidoreductase subunit 3 (subunit A)